MQAERFACWCSAVDDELMAPLRRSKPGDEAADGAAEAGSTAHTTTEDVAHDTTDSDCDDDDAPLPRVAILEIGAGGNVVTVRMRSERLLERWNSHADCTLVRINPDLPCADNKDNSDK